MSSFPLYDTFYKKASDAKLSTKEENEFLKNMQVIDEKGHEYVYGLIKHYSIVNNNASNDTPFSGERCDNTFSFNLDEIPNKLKRMLFIFTKEHLEIMKNSGG
jgi:hypothetical protein